MSKHDKQIEKHLPQQIEARAWTFSGPLPPPEILERYNNAFPGAAERIVEMAERQSAHRQTVEGRVIDSHCRAQTRGQYLGFVVAMTALVGGFALIWNGKDAVGITSIIASLGSLVMVFVVGRTRQKQELAKKAEAFGPKPVQP